MQVTHYQRRPQGPNYSIERLFADVRAAMRAEVEAKVAVSRFTSRGLLRRIYNTIEATFRQGDVNHITGDVHFLTFLLRRDRTLLTVHDLVSIQRLRGLKRRALFIFWYWLPIRRSAVVTVISNSTKEELLRHVRIDPQKVRVVPDCVSAGFRPAPSVFNAARPVILQVGTKPNKNVERVAKAIQGIPCHLRVIGLLDRHQTALLHEYGIDYSSVANLSDEQVIDEYRRCDMLVFASTYEGFGLPIVEAQATGRPVVTSNVYSMPEVAGDGACLVDPFDVESIRNGIMRVLCDANYRSRLLEHGHRNVQRFRPETIAAQYADLYAEIVGRPTVNALRLPKAA